MFNKKKKYVVWMAGIIFVLACVLATAGFATGAIPNLLVSPAKESAAISASTRFAERNGLLSAAEANSKLVTNYAAEESALLTLCNEYGVSLTEEEESYCNSYYETVMPIMEADENPDALNTFNQIVEDSGLTLQEYEEVSEANMKYSILREKLISEIYSDDADAYTDAIAKCIQDNGF